MMERLLSVQGQRVVEAIEAGRRLRRRAGGWAAGPLVAPDSLVSELERRGMVRRAGEGLVLGEAGRPGAGGATVAPTACSPNARCRRMASRAASPARPGRAA